eukprot:6222011-Pyramimonas_sp.AAC.1
MHLVTGWDSSKLKDRETAFNAITKEKPWTVLLEPPCLEVSAIRELFRVLPVNRLRNRTEKNV